MSLKMQDSLMLDNFGYSLLVLSLDSLEELASLSSISTKEQNQPKPPNLKEVKTNQICKGLSMKLDKINLQKKLFFW